MAKHRGKLIVLDAIDGAGKTTQVKLLVRYLRQNNIKHYRTDFPQYDRSFFGKMIKHYLSGGFGDIGKTDPYLISLLYALDRYEAKSRMRRYLNKGRIIISDRYSPANKIHQTTKIGDKKRKIEFINWLDEMEFRVLGIPKPDLVLFLDVPPKFTMVMTRVRGKRDKHEVDLSHQSRAYRQSLWLVKRYPHWKRIVCVRNDKLLPREVIHRQILRHIGLIV